MEYINRIYSKSTERNSNGILLHFGHLLSEFCGQQISQKELKQFKQVFIVLNDIVVPNTMEAIWHPSQFDNPNGLLAEVILFNCW